jgi:hypothetical protein
MQVSDAFAPWNHAVFEVTAADGQAVVQKLEYADGSSGEGADIAITIEGLSQLVMGARSAQKLHRQKELVCEPEYLAVLQQLWPEQSLYFNEYY